MTDGLGPVYPARSCPRCGTPSEAGDVFCQECGDYLAGTDHYPAPAGYPPPAGLPPEGVEVLVQVASYVAAAAAGGVIGNRTDAGIVAVTTRLFRSVSERWRRRTSTADESLSEDEAIDVAKAVALSQGFDQDGLIIDSAEQMSGGEWIVRLHDRSMTARVRVPPGDPANATLLIVVS